MAGIDLLLNIIVGGNQSAAKDLKNISVAVAGIGASFAAVGKIISDVASQFDTAVRNISSISDLTDKQFKRLSDSVKNLSLMDGISDSATGLSTAMYDLVSSGFNAAKSLELAAVASHAATAGLTQTKTSVQALAALMNAYNEKTLKDGKRFSDELFTVVKNGVVTFDQLANNLGAVIPIASSLNVSFKQVGAAFIELTKSGVQASQAETAIAGLLKAISSASPEIRKQAQEMGLDVNKSFSELALNTRGLGAVMADIGKVTGGSFSQLKKLIPDIEAVNAAVILTKNSAKDFNQSIVDMGKSAGNTQKALSEQTKTYAYQVNKLKAEFDNLKITFGELLNKALVPFIAQIREGIKFIMSMDDSTKKAIINFGLFISGLTAAGIAIGGLSLAITPLITGVISLIGWLAGGAGLTVAFHSLAMLIGSGGAFGVAIIGVTASVIAIGKIIEGIREGYNTLKAIAGAKIANKELEDTKKTALGLVQEFRNLSNERRKALDSTELHKYSVAFAQLITSATNPDARKRLKDLSQELANLAKGKELEESNKIASEKAEEQADKLKAINAGMIAEKAKEQDKANRKAESEAKRHEEQLKQSKEQAEDEIDKLTLDSYEYRRLQAKKEFNERITLTKKGTSEYILFEKAYQAELTQIRKDEEEKRNEDLKEAGQNRLRILKENLSKEAEEERNLDSIRKSIVDIRLQGDKKTKSTIEESIKSSEDRQDKALQDRADKANDAINEQIARENRYIDTAIQGLEGLISQATGMDREFLSIMGSITEKFIKGDVIDPIQIGIQATVLFVRTAIGSIKSEVESMSKHGVKTFEDGVITTGNFIKSISPPSILFKLLGFDDRIKTSGEAKTETKKIIDDTFKSINETIMGYIKGKTEAEIEYYQAIANKEESTKQQKLDSAKKVFDKKLADIEKLDELQETKDFKQKTAQIEYQAIIDKINKDELENIDKVSKKVQESNKKIADEIQKKTKLELDGLNLIKKGYDELKKKITELYEKESQQIANNIKDIKSKYQTELDRINEIKKLLSKDEDESKLNAQINTSFEKDKNKKISESPGSFYRQTEEEFAKSIKRRENILADSILAGMSVQDRIKEEKDISQTKIAYLEEYKNKFTENSDAYLQAETDIRLEKEKYFASEKERIQKNEETNRLEGEKYFREQELKSLAEKQKQEIENAKKIDAQYSSSIQKLNTDLADSTAKFQMGIIQVARDFGAEIRQQLQDTLNQINQAKSNISSSSNTTQAAGSYENAPGFIGPKRPENSGYNTVTVNDKPTLIKILARALGWSEDATFSEFYENTVEQLKSRLRGLSVPGFKMGGISDGSTSGYPITAHGKELHLNETQSNNLFDKMGSLFRLANISSPLMPNTSNYAYSSANNITIINSFDGAKISNDMDLRSIGDYVDNRLNKALQKLK